MQQLPEILEKALLQDWSAALLPIASSHSLFTIARGTHLSTAGEAALKFKETCRLHAEAYSAAEVRHGPIALARERFAALFFAADDDGLKSIQEAEKALHRAGASVLVVGQSPAGGHELPFAQTNHPLLDPISQIVSFYCFVESLAVGLI
jgi:glucosamine--fructose-6-phosphate aminotransferase (isomerizing)